MHKKRKNKLRKPRNAGRMKFLFKRNNFKHLIAFVLLTLVVTVLYLLLFKSQYFRLDEIQVTGEYPLSAQKILTVTSISENQSIWSVDLSNISLMLKENYPEYRKIIVKRELPNLLLFDFILRKPIAQIKSGRYFLVDKYNFILPQVKNVADSNLPVIRGIDSKLVGIKAGKQCSSKAVKNAIELLEAIQDADIFKLSDLTYIDASDFKNLFFALNNRIIVKIGDTDFRNRITKLSYVLKEIEGEDIAYIDLRFKDPVLSPR